MRIELRDDSVIIDGYVNAVERDSKPLWSRVGRFIERICAGAFDKAIKRNDDIHILLNHSWDRDLGSTKAGNLELKEDNIGLKARATITDKEVIEKARAGRLVGWSFGFTDVDVENGNINGMPTRAVKDLNLFEVSILDDTKTPAYNGTLVTVRAEGDEAEYRAETFNDGVELIDNTEDVKEREEEKEEPQQTDKTAEAIDYTKYENLIKEMKGE